MPRLNNTAGNRNKVDQMTTVSPDMQRKMLRQMQTIRRFEEHASAGFLAGDIYGVVHCYIGEEAVAVGMCAALNQDDKIISTHRGHGHCIAKGADLKRMMAELYGRETGYCKGKGGSMHIADVSKGMLGANAIVGGAAPLALGAALKSKTRGDRGVAVAFAGDGATNQGTTFEAMNMAVVLKLPLIFVIENNGYGEHTGVGYAVGNDLTARTAGFGMPAEKVDGTDFVAMYEAMGRAVERARKGDGPSAIEAVAMRWHGHFEGDAQAYRPKGEIAELRKSADPLKIFRARALAEKAMDKATLDRIDEDAAKAVDAAVEVALAAPLPDVSELLTDVYVDY